MLSIMAIKIRLANKLRNKSAEAEGMRNKMGFSLMELMVTLSMFAVIAALAVPSITGWRSEAKLKDAVSLLRGDLEMAKLKAINECGFVAILFNVNGYTMFVDNGAGGGIEKNWIRDGSEEQVRNRQMPAGVHIDMADTDFNGTDQTRFNARGRISDNGVVKIVNNAENHRQININRFGMITVN